MDYKTITEGNFKYIETKGKGDTILLLHGLFGALSNFKELMDRFGSEFNIIVPLLPITTLPKEEAGIMGLVKHIEAFVDFKELKRFHILGNSLGGHLAQLFSLEHLDKIISLCLTGSSGLYENPMGSSWPKRESRDYVRGKVEGTFYDPKIATDELVDEVYNIINDRMKVIMIVLTAKSAIRHNLEDKLHLITVPTLLIWGKQDSITPEFVALKFHEHLPNSRLEIIDECGHAAMMERPKTFNNILGDFLANLDHK